MVQALHQVCNAIPEAFYAADHDALGKKTEDVCGLFELLYGLAVSTRATSRGRGAQKAMTTTQKRKLVELRQSRWRRRIAQVEKAAYELMTSCEEVRRDLEAIAHNRPICPVEMRAEWFKAWSVNATRHFQHNELDEAFRSRAEREINYYDTYQTRRTINVKEGPAFESVISDTMVLPAVESLVPKSVMGAMFSPSRKPEDAMIQDLQTLSSNVFTTMERFGKRATRRDALVYLNKIRAFAADFGCRIAEFVIGWNVSVLEELAQPPGGQNKGAVRARARGDYQLDNSRFELAAAF